MSAYSGHHDLQSGHGHGKHSTASDSTSGPAGGRRPVPHTHGSNLTDGKEEFYWYCCECKDGPNNMKLHVACPICFHKQCDRCRFEKFIVKK